ncbi:MAG: FecR domain-containing protein [Gammaproteobacteria bacterium]
MSDPIPYRRRALATFVAASCGALSVSTAHAAVNAGKVDYVVGNVTATSGDGTQRALAKGTAIRVGDTIETNTGRAWLRFADGGYMSLQPRTEFRVDDYHFEGEEAEEEKSFFSLLKGGMRAVTGFIGQRNRDAYKVKTPVATIGIRGTEYLATLGESLTVSCGEGICVVTNEVGEVVLQAGQTVYMKDPTTRGERRTRKVVLPPNAPVVFTGGEFRNDDGTLAVVPPPEEPDPPVTPDPPVPPEPPPPIEEDPFQLVSGENTGLFMALSYGGEDGSFNMARDTVVETGTGPDFVTGVLNDDFALEQASWDDDGAHSIDFTAGDAMAEDVAIDPDGIIAWGRWTGDSIEGTEFAGGELGLFRGNWSAHYLVGKPTPETDLTALASANTTAVYNLIGATSPSFGDDGFEGSFDFGDIVSITGALTANFGASTVTTSLDLDFEKNDVSINSDAMPIAGGPGGRFGGVGQWATSTLNGGSGNFNTTIQGFFAGANAARAGYAYDVFIDSVETPYSIHGVAGFAKGSSATPE